MNEIYKAEKRFAVLDHIPMGICVLRKDSVVLFWNKCIEDWTGIQRKNISGTEIFAHFPHLRDPKYSLRLKDVFEGGPPTVFSSQLHKCIIPSYKPDKRLRLQHTIVTPVPAFNEKDFYALFTMEDVTELTNSIQEYRVMRDHALEEIKERSRVAEELKKHQYYLEELVDARTSNLTAANERLQKEIVERNKVEEHLRKNERFLSMIFDSIRDPFCIIERNYTIVRANEAYVQMRGKLLEDFIGKRCYEVLQNRGAQCDDCVVEKTFISGDTCVKDKPFSLSGGFETWVEIYTYPIFNEEDRITHVIEYTRDVTERKRAEKEKQYLIKELEYLSRTDSLTGLLNRRALIERFNHEISRAKRYDSELSIIFCDIDRLKEVNDTCGHNTGDKVIQAVSETMEGVLRNADVAGRYGGDEFLVILPETPLDGAENLAERIRSAVEKVELRLENGHTIGMSISLGIAKLDTSKEDIDMVTKRADAALYTSKREGRNRVYVIR